jgi:hypothetical protein
VNRRGKRNNEQELEKQSCSFSDIDCNSPSDSFTSPFAGPVEVAFPSPESFSSSLSPTWALTAFLAAGFLGVFDFGDAAAVDAPLVFGLFPKNFLLTAHQAVLAELLFLEPRATAKPS